MHSTRRVSTKQYNYQSRQNPEASGIDEPIAMIVLTGANQGIYFYYYDGLGSVAALSNISGQIVEGYTYDAFGNVAIHTSAGNDGIWLNGDPGTNYDNYSSTGSPKGNPYMFTGRRLDPETRSSEFSFSGLYYYRARMYNPKLAHFCQTDPIGYYDSMNLYQYAFNSPTNYLDPFGLSSKGSSAMGWVHGGLDVVGVAGDFFGPIGAAVAVGADLINAGIYAFEGEWVEAGLSASSAIPYAGNAVKARKAAKTVALADAASDAARAADRANDARRASNIIKHGHHPWPKYLGGPAKQTLESLPPNLHTKYHAVLVKMLPRRKGTEYFKYLSPQEQAENFEKLRTYTQAFDKQYGTNIWDAVKKTASAID